MTQVQNDQPIFDAEGNEIDPDDSTAIREARAAADRNSTRADAAERRAAILEVMPPVANASARTMFLDSYKGEPTEEAVTEALVAVGLIQAVPSAEVAEQETVDAAAQAARTNLQTGALAPEEQPDPELVEDPREIGLAKYREAKLRGATNENASAQFFDRVVSAAVRGDERVIHRGYTEAELKGHVDV